MLTERSEDNPILKPRRDHSWESLAVFNGCPVFDERGVRLIYRAVSLPHYCTISQRRMPVSIIGIGESVDGVEFHNRRKLIFPEKKWEKYGCEDPRVTKLGNKYFIFYTALSTYPFSAEGIKVGLAISNDLINIKEKHLITPFNAKAMALFPEKIKGKLWAILSVNTDKPPSSICVVSFDKEEDMWNKKRWEKWYANFKKYSLNLANNLDQVEVGAPPIKTNKGWLIIYSHIKNYFSSKRLFTIKAILLDKNNPQKIIGKYDMPLLVPEEYYEKIGYVPNVIFPSGAFVKDENIYLYYGAADTTCCLAKINMNSLLGKLTGTNKIIKFKRLKNPLLKPNLNNSWESQAVFNPGAIQLNGKVHLLYRAMSKDNVSVFGYARSDDGKHITYRSKFPVYVPRMSFEKKKSSGNSGCEDPRLTLIDNKVYMTYTAFDGKNPPRVALTSINVNDFLSENWKWEKPILISPPGLDDKDACVFPEKIGNKYFIIHRSGEDIDSAIVSDLNFKKEKWVDEYRWILPRKGWWDSKKIGLAAPPIKTKYGWIMLYHGISDDNIYRVGALLLDLNNPFKVISRTDDPLLEPELPEEKRIVFPCGAVLMKNKLFIYYGADDKEVCGAFIDINKLIKLLKSN